MAGHGGAWKVAFADFMTAMMALFLVLWISAQDRKILIATSRYFHSPFRSPVSEHSGVMPFSKDSVESTNPEKKDDNGSAKTSQTDRQIELTFLNSVAADFARLLNLDQDLAKKPIDVEVTSDGLRITLFDRTQKPLFVGNTTTFTEWGNYVMQNLAWMIDRHHFLVTIDGHTRQGFPTTGSQYTAWELSADRANASRRKLVHYAVEPGLIERVTGYADTQPLPNEPATSESNQRVTLSLRLNTRVKEAPKAAPAQFAATTQPTPSS